MRNPKRVYRFIKTLPGTLAAIRSDIASLRVQYDNTAAHAASLRDDTKALNTKIDHLSQKQSDLTHQLSAVSAPTAVIKSKPSGGLQADHHNLDGYYKAFEEKFRGSEEMISDRLRESYLALLTDLPAKVKKATTIDIGCGRGELLRLYSETGITSLGIDLNQAMVERCKEQGLDAIQADALAYLKEQPSASLGGVSGIHFVEHVPFEVLYTLLNECYRVLVPGGFILFETPNPENLVVGACTFWYDSSHLKPIPPDVLEFATGYVGFETVSVMRMHPAEESTTANRSKDMKEVMQRLRGPRDYAVFALKN